ncbi:TPA: hypothetical protein ACGANW_001413 [Legionella pneumophila]
MISHIDCKNMPPEQEKFDIAGNSFLSKHGSPNNDPNPLVLANAC